jgi:arabinofuranan 3-O-arabinosyltransferase
MGDNVSVSVIIPTYNSGESIERCLRSIKNQSYPGVESIVVDNHSIDQTREISERYGVTFLLFRGNRSRARNAGFKLSQGRYILYLDSDQELAEGLLEECIWLCEERVFDSLIIRELTVGENYWAQCLNFERKLASDSLDKEIPRFHRAVFLRDVGGFDETLEFGEDWDLYIRLKNEGSKVGRASTYILHHENSDLRSIIRKYRRYGEYLPQLASRYSVASIISQYNPLLSDPRTFLVHFVKDPLHGSGFLFLRMIRGFIMLFGVKF